MSKCWYCNNELTTGDNPKHFGICNKCYDEMFKSGDTIIRSLTNKIEELQNKLAKQSEWIENNKNKAKNCAIQMNNQAKEITRLKQSNKDLMRVIWNTKRERAKKGREICKANNYMIAKDKQIVELQQQIEKKEKSLEYFRERVEKAEKEIKDNYKQYNQLVNEYNELITKLQSQPAEIVEKIRNLAEKDFDFDTCTCCGEDVHDDVVLTKNDFNKILENCLTVKN